MAKISDNQIYELQRGIKLTPKRLSRISDKISLEQVVTRLAQQVIDNRILAPPYWGYITINQIIWGNGKHWKNDESLESMGLMKHAGLSRPPNFVLMKQAIDYGYMMAWPPREIHEIIVNAMNDNILNPIYDSTTDIGYVGASCKGKIDNETGKYLPQFRQKITTYFLWNSDESLFPQMKAHIMRTELWERKQWQMALEKMPEQVARKIKIAETIGSRAISQANHYQIGPGGNYSTLLDKLNPEVPESEIDWRVNGDDLIDD